MHFVNSLDNLALVLAGAQSVVGMNAANHQNFFVQLDFPRYLRAESAVAGINATRFQRAPEGPGQSTAGRRHHVVKSGRVGGKRLWGDLVVRRDLGVDSENHRLFFSRQVGETHGASLPLNSYLRAVDDSV